MNNTVTYFSVLFIIVGGLALTGCAQKTRTMSPKKAKNSPYVIKGKKYHPQKHYEYDEVGVASYYGIRDGFHGKKTSTGEVFNAHGLTAAHKTLPLPSVVRVTNLKNGRSLHLKVNDRGPFVDGRIIDVSRKAAQLLGFYREGTTKVRVECMVAPSLALLQQPQKGVPFMMAKADSSQRKQFDFSELPVQKLLAQTDQRESRSPSKKRAGWSAVKEFLTPVAQRKPHSISQRNAVVSPLKETAGMFLQVGTFSNYKNAERLSHKLKRLTKGAPVRLNMVEMNNASMFVVRMGPVSSSVEAENLVKQMAKAGHHDVQIIYK